MRLQQTSIEDAHRTVSFNGGKNFINIIASDNVFYLLANILSKSLFCLSIKSLALKLLHLMNKLLKTFQPSQPSKYLFNKINNIHKSNIEI